MSPADKPGPRSWPKTSCSTKGLASWQQNGNIKVDRKKSQTWFHPHLLLLKPWLLGDWGRPIMTSWDAFVDSQCKGWITLQGLANHLFHEVCSIPLWAARSFSRIICYSLAIWKHLSIALPVKVHTIFGYRFESRLTTGAYFYSTWIKPWTRLPALVRQWVADTPSPTLVSRANWCNSET